VEATGAPVGPAVAEGRALKAAVPAGQRFGPALPPGTNTRQVLGVGEDGRARIGELALEGRVSSARGELPLGGLNQYALPVDSVGLFTKDWGAASRARATCGTDTRRDAPCSDETYEVTLRGGQVVAVAESPGRGAIEPGTEVLLGREAGARELRHMAVGDRVHVTYALHALDGSAGFRTGLTVVEVADTMRDLGATDAVNLDGGGSSTLVARKEGASRVSVLNHPSGGAQRAVPNGIGVFVRPGSP
jgi:hypothetical protein